MPVQCSIVVYAFDGSARPRSCLEALLRSPPVASHEILVVLGPRVDPTRETVSGGVRVVEAPGAVSPAQAGNLGARSARGDHVAFLDADVTPEPGWLDRLLEAIESDPEIGAVGSKILYRDGTVEHAGVAFGPHALPHRNLPYRLYRGADPDAAPVGRPRTMPAVVRAGMLLSRRTFVDVGGFDESYRRTLEDVDLCLRLRARELSTLYCPGSVLHRDRVASRDAMDEYGPDARRLEARWAGHLVMKDEVVCRQDGVEVNRVRALNARVATWALLGDGPVEGPPMVAWTAPLFNWSGYAEEARNAIMALDRAGVTIHANALHWPEPIPRFDAATAGRLRELCTADLRDPFIHVMHIDGGSFLRSPRAVRNIGRTLYEADALPSNWVARCNDMDEVWVASEFNVETFARTGVHREKLHKIPQAIDPLLYDASVAPLALGGVSGFTFLSVWHWLARKGWDLLIRAYLEEFRRSDDVTLLLKIAPRPGRTVADHRDQLDAFVRRELGRDPARGPRVVLLDRTLSTEEMPRLYRAADAYVMPSRGEGWGRPYMEAMAMGLPTIGTRWSGNLEYMTDDNAYLIDCRLVPVPEAGLRDEPGFLGLRWAEPSVEHLRALMRQVFENREEAAVRGARARQDVLHRFNWDRVAAMMIDRLRAPREPRGKEPVPRSLRPERARSPRPAVVWTSSLVASTGYAEEARNFVLALDRAGAPLLVNAVPMFGDGAVPLAAQTAERLQQLAGADLPDRFINVMHCQPPAFRRRRKAIRNIGRTTYELDGLPPHWVACCNEMDEIWVPGEFNVETFARAGVDRHRLHKVPQAIQAELYDPTAPPLPLPDASGFVFLSNIRWGLRKGWDVLIRAFLEEFRRRDDVTLLLKIGPGDGKTFAQSHRELHAFVRRELGRDPARGPRVVLLDRTLSAEEMPRLYRAADAYVMPSRGEGWGRPYMEAMAMGLPTIGTRWSGNLEYMTDDNAYLIDCRLVPVPEPAWREPHLYGLRWAEPSVEHLRALMRRVFEDRAEAGARGARARQEVLERYGWGRVAEAIMERLEDVPSVRPGWPVMGSRGDRPISVVWEGPQFSHGSLAVVNRNICRRLAEDPGIELSLRSDEPTEPLPDPGASALTSLARRASRRASAVHVRHAWPPDLQPPPEGRWVTVLPWEYRTLPVAWIEPLRRVDEVWVPSRFVREGFVENGLDPSRVVVIPNGVDPAVFFPGAPPLRLPTDKSFRFLFVGGTLRRKGADILLETYLQTFGPEDDVCLVVKDFGTHSFYRGQGLGERIREAQADPRNPAILYSAQELSSRAVASLYTACQALVFPYRAEGFGLPIAEAMACGLSVIVPDRGPAREFCDPSVANLIPADEVHLRDERIGGLPTVGRPEICEVDRAALARTMRRVVERREEAAAMGRRAAYKIHREWSWARAADAASRRLRALDDRPVRWGSGREPPPAEDRWVYPKVIASPRGVQSASGPPSPAPLPARRKELSVCLVVRDEEQLLPQCLDSVRGLADEIVVVDTGSVDRTVAIAREYGAKVLHMPWTDDFAPVRNEYLRHATKEWILVLDGDNTLDRSSHEEVRRLIQTEELVGFAPRQFSYMDPEGEASVLEHPDVRLFPNHPELRYVGRIHAQLLPRRPDLGYRITPCDVVIHNHGYRPRFHDVTEHAERYARVIEAEAREEPNEAFHAYNLGVVYHILGRRSEAERELRRAIDLCRPVLREGLAPLFLVHTYVVLAQVLLAQDRPQEAAAWCDAALRIAPKLADVHCVLAVSQVQMGRLDAAMASYRRALEFADEPSLFATDRSIGKWKGLLGMGEIHVLLGQWPEAVACLQRAHAAAPNNGAVLTALGEALLGLGRVEEARDFLSRAVQAPGAPPAARQILSGLAVSSGTSQVPAPLSAAGLVHHGPKTWSDDSVVFLCKEAPLEWGPDSLEAGCGGSEEAIIQLTKRLAARGFAVTVFNNCPREETRDGVVWMRYERFDPRDKFDRLVGWRKTAYGLHEIRARMKILDLHDVVAEEAMPQAVIQDLTLCVKSRFHRDLFPNIPDHRFRIIPNGIDLSLFQSERPKRRNLLVWTSSPDRGLDHLLEMWPEITSRVPGVRLEVFYGFDYFDVAQRRPEDRAIKSRLLSLLEQPAVTFRGRVSHAEISEAYLRADVLPYLTAFEEIDCISVAKAQAAGCIPVTTDCGALALKNRFGLRIHGAAGVGDTNERFKEALIDLLADEERKERLRVTMRGTGDDWETIADRWAEVLREPSRGLRPVVHGARV